MRKKYVKTVTEVAKVQMTTRLLAGSEGQQSAPGVKGYRVGYSEVTGTW